MTIKILISALCLMWIYLTIKTIIQINKINKDIKRTDEIIEQLRQESIEALQQEPKCEDCKWNTWDNNCMVEYRGCRFEPKNGE